MRVSRVLSEFWTGFPWVVESFAFMQEAARRNDDYCAYSNVRPSEYIGADLGTVGAGSLSKSTELRLELRGNIQGGHAPDEGELCGRRERWDDGVRSLRPL
jgi:hypothetical protein